MAATLVMHYPKNELTVYVMTPSSPHMTLSATGTGWPSKIFAIFVQGT
jgi:hypothetical protein